MMAIAMVPAFMITSCDYLDVYPPEQAGPEDTMEDKELTINFLTSCYHAVLNMNPLYYNNFMQSTDEYVNPPLWNDDSQKTAWNQLNGEVSPNTWELCYGYIGQCHLFLREIARQNPMDVTEEDKQAWINEVNFLKAYYHYRLLEAYGPIPIMEEYPSQNITNDEIPGRRHYDYCVDYIVGLLDQCINSGLLPPVREGNEWGRATSTAAKALKARLLIQAASPLWNGSFPFPDWKNKRLTGDEEYDSKYGLELVSHTYDPSKWEKALEASLDALNYALNEGQRKLFDVEDGMALFNIMSGLDINDIFVPTANGEPVDENFVKHVIALRIMMSSYENQGNRENIWAYYTGNDSRSLRRKDANFPIRIIYKNNSWQHGYAANAPTLYSVEHFYTKDGYIPAQDPNFADESEWFQRAGVEGENRGDIIKLNVNREPRFYAWIAFDGDDYAPRMANGEPLTLDMKSSNDARTGLPGNGWSSQFNRDYSVTGYLCKKFCQINQENNESDSNGTAGNAEDYPMPIFRLAELYLNVAECYAELGQTAEALKYLNPIRLRAGIPELTEQMIATSGMNIIDWVRNERFVELWGESIRYFDVRRWMIAPQQLAANAREGLNVQENYPDPSFEEFNQRAIIRQNFQWENRMYLLPILNKEVYAAPRLVQAPNY